jgi:hypothetical protein
MRHHLTSGRIAIIKRLKIPISGKEYREKRALEHCWWEGKLVQPFWKTVWRFLKKLKIELPI